MKRCRLTKIVCLIMIGCMLMGCQTSNSNPSSNEVENGKDKETILNTNGQSPTEPSQGDEQAPTQAVPEVKKAESILGKPIQDFVCDLKYGWNLGNSFDSIGDSETSWGNPKVTKELIDTIAAKGFNTIRIPVTWVPHMGMAPDYTIREEWLARVKEVVDYCMANDMYVILNSHHEDSWMIVDEDHYEKEAEQLTKLWTQVATYFKDYGDHLIFEGMNEPRVKGGENEWNGGTKEGREVLNRMLQVFVDTVRGTGGNNETRCLLVTTFAASSCDNSIRDVVIPKDENIALSIHAYTPYKFTFNSNESFNTSEWKDTDQKDIDYLFKSLNDKFVSKGIPVIITEFGSVKKTLEDGESTNLEDRKAWVTYYLQKAKETKIPCIWWDNGCFNGSGELFGIINRRTYEWFEPDYIDTMMKVINE